MKGGGKLKEPFVKFIESEIGTALREFNTGIYSGEFSRLTCDIMLSVGVGNAK